MMGKNFWIERIKAVKNQDIFSTIAKIHMWKGNIPILKTRVIIKKVTDKFDALTVFKLKITNRKTFDAILWVQKYIINDFSYWNIFSSINIGRKA